MKCEVKYQVELSQRELFALLGCVVASAVFARRDPVVWEAVIRNAASQLAPDAFAGPRQWRADQFGAGERLWRAAGCPHHAAL